MLYCSVEKAFNVSAVYCRVNHVSIFFTLLAWVGDLRPSLEMCSLFVSFLGKCSPFVSFLGKCSLQLASENRLNFWLGHFFTLDSSWKN